MLKNLRKKLKKFFVGTLGALTMASAVTVPAVTSTMDVQAAGVLDNESVYRALKDMTGVDLSNSATWQNNVYLSRPLYGYDAGSLDLMLSDTTPPSLTYDCVRFAYAVLARAIRYSGGNPSDYIKGINYPKDYPSKSLAGATAYSDVSNAEPGDIIEYTGTMGHLDVVLGRDSSGNLWTIGGSYSGHGPIVRMYTGVSGSGGYTAHFYRLYHYDHSPRDITVTANLTKTSAEVNVTTGNSSYSLQGAKYSVYAGGSATGTSIGTLTTDANGRATGSFTVPANTTQITIKETTAPNGYELDPTPHTVNISGTTASFTVSDSPKKQNISIELNKSSAIPNITNGNNCYSLDGAVYKVSYVNPIDGTTKVVLGDITTDATGHASGTFTGIPLGVTQLKVQEVTSPKGYLLDTKEYTVTLNDVGSGTLKGSLEVKDNPANDPLNIFLYKISEDSVGNPASLEGAEFTVKYYDVNPERAYTSTELSGMTPNRTWIITTKKDENGNYKAVLDNDHKVSGDDFYSPLEGSGELSVLPLGVITVKETKAPNGYTLDNSVTYSYNGTTHTYDQATDGTAIFYCRMNNVFGANIIAGNEFTFVEGVSRGGLKIQKHDTQTGLASQGDATNLTTVYRITNLNNYDVVMKVNGNTITAGPNEQFNYDIVTDANGYWESPTDNGKQDFLQNGTYRIDEVTSPTGYTIAADENRNMSTSVTFTISNDQEVVDQTSTLGDDVIRGGFTVRKNDSDTKTNDRQGPGTMKTTFSLINKSSNPVVVNGRTFANGDYIDIDGDGNAYFSTDDNGVYTSPNNLLPYGSYQLIEVQAPEGYTQNGTTSVEFSVRGDGEIVDLTNEIYNDVLTGQFSIYKHYNEYDKSEWDDTPEAGATFLAIKEDILNTIFGGDIFDAYEKIVDVIGGDLSVNGKVTENGSEAQILYNRYGLTPKYFSILVTGDDGFATSSPLAYGTYKIHQINGDPNAIINDDYATFTVSGITSTIKDVNGMDVTVYSNQLNRLYSVTNDYKTYQLKIVKKDALTGETIGYSGASFKIGYDSDGDGVWTDADRNFNKKFSDFNEVVNGFVTQTLGTKKYNTFRTYNGNDPELPKGTFVLDDENATAADKGTVTLPLQVMHGTYFIFEMDNDDASLTETPWGYITTEPDKYGINGDLYNKSDNNAKYPVAGEIQLDPTHYIVMDNGGTENTFKDDLYSATVEIYNTRVLGTLNIHKSIEDFSSDKTFINRDDLSGFKFELRAKEDIINPVDGTVIANAGDLAKVYNNGYVQLDAFNVDANGDYTITNLPLGEYELYEVEQPLGTVTNTDPIPVSIVQPDNDRTTTEIVVNKNIENYTTKFEFSKKTVTGDDELPGASLRVIDEDGATVDQWISTDQAHIIEGLTAGKKYTLIEDLAPLGFVKATSIEFTVEDSKEIQTVEMIDKVVTFSKKDAKDAFLPGAEFEVYEWDGNDTVKNDDGTEKVISTWTSGTDVHNIENLEAGKTYIIRETGTPEGYVTATDIVLEVYDDGQDQQVKMIDKIVEFRKTDVKDKNLEGAEIEVYELNGSDIVKNEDGTNKVIATWTSDTEAHNIENLIAGKTYVIRETGTPEGYVTASDIIVEVYDDGQDQQVRMIDMIVENYKKDVKFSALSGAKMQILDLTGKIIDEWVSDGTPHRAVGLKAGETYILHEVEAPKGYAIAKDIEFTVDEDGTDKVNTMIDKQIVVFKNDVDGKPVEGAILNVTDSNGHVVDSWITTKLPHAVENLVVGNDYLLNEQTPAKGYVKADSILFTVEDDEQNQIVKMIDKYVTVEKVDTKGNAVKGVTLSVIDGNGKTVDSWKTDGTEHRVDGLKEGKTYTIRETGTPEGYVTANDIKFTVTGASKKGIKINQEYTMIDKTVTIEKTDTSNKGLAGATLSVINKDGEVVDTWETDGKPHKVSGLNEDETYILTETKTPEGYVTASDIEFTVTGEKDGVKEDQKYTMVDKTVSINKTDGEGHEVPGAVVTVIDKDGNVVDKWTSTDKPHNVSGMKVGESYTWHEEYSADLIGYYYAEDYEFTVTDDGINQEFEMVDSPIRYAIAKVDDNGNYVKGVTLELLDITDPESPIIVELPNDGVTTDKPFDLDKKLIAEHRYELTESEYVAGVYKATKIEFVVPKFGTPEVTTITMHDENTVISVLKLDNHGKPLAGAKLSILMAEKDSEGNIVPVLDEEGNAKVVYSWVSEEEATDVSPFVKGSNDLSGDVWYILHEDEPPFGFNAFEDIPFTVTGNMEESQVIVGTDTRDTYYVSAVKVDKADHSKKLKGAEITLFNHDGTIAVDVNGEKCIGLTDGKGVLTWNVEYSDEPYYVQETDAPIGYKINPDHYDVELSLDFFESEAKAYQIVVEDEIKSFKGTGVGIETTAFAACFGAISALGLMNIYDRKKKKKEEE